MDQNETLQRYHISSFAIIDGYSRTPIHAELTTALSGGAHTSFFSNAITKTKKIPDILSLDYTGRFVYLFCLSCPRAVTNPTHITHISTSRLLEWGSSHDACRLWKQ